jgi:hypothetical protein
MKMEKEELERVLYHFEESLIEAQEVLEIFLEDFDKLNFGKVGKPSHMVDQLEKKLSDVLEFVEEIEDIIEAIKTHNFKRD